ncbi:Krr1-domain-containing protein [Microthyrium microscopicum]|uniref:Krr1-domain-containing protein n=1 Tax=Microthyrium microscopicum TaxID=703497 RepID=A0A6A6U186_9PEZI|nr:Krr1-domain-containing protein [Microthyrium microscopicum]
MAAEIQYKRKSSDHHDASSSSGPQKRLKLLDDEEDSSSAGEEKFQINQDYARRFEHNKSRAELHRLEKKYGKNGNFNEEEDDEEDSESEDEDEAGELVDEEVDAEISATLAAIRSKDPRIYSTNTQFYTERDDASAPKKEYKDAPMYLRDYHLQNLLGDSAGKTKQDVNPSMPYVQEQEALKRNLIHEINAATDGVEVASDDDGDFMVRKQSQMDRRKTEKQAIPDPATADRNPDTFLSNFFASRAWVPTDKASYAPLDSDDEEEEEKAEKFEHAWNLRFEDPDTANKVLTTHSREVVAKYSVRREDATGRKAAREREKQRKEEEKALRQEERNRLKNLKVRQMEEKLDKIREAAGLRGKDVTVEEWADMLEADWDDDKWNEEMETRFGEHYYEQAEALSDIEADQPSKVQKPKWDDDIDIKDIVSDFEEDDPLEKFELTDEEKDDDAENGESEGMPEVVQPKAKSKASLRRDRRVIEALAEQSTNLDVGGVNSKEAEPFRYRETSPNTFGLTTLDILAAEDSHLNQYAGLKKLAAFRDPERKKTDKKKLSKKARLRSWRKETFGREDGPDPTTIFAATAAEKQLEEEQNNAMQELQQKPKKRKRSRKTKVQSSD